MELAPYLCYQLDFLLDFFTEDKSYQYLQDAISIFFLSDKSTEILGLKYLIIWKFSILAAWPTHLFSKKIAFAHVHDITSTLSQVRPHP